jgi:hypothetical protein
MFIFITRSLPAYFFFRVSTVGLNILQGMHQTAQKSISIGTFDLMIWSKRMYDESKGALSSETGGGNWLNARPDRSKTIARGLNVITLHCLFR